MSTADYSNVVQSLYVAYFGRPADYFGLQNFSAALSAANAPTTVTGLENAYFTNPAVKALVDSFGSSAESTALYTGGSLEFVSSIYQNLFGRAPELAGLLFWSNAIDSGGVSKGDAALAIMSGAVANTSGPDAATIANKVAVATEFTSALDTSAEIIGYSGALAASQARSLLSTVTSSSVPDAFQIQNTVNEIVNFPGLNTPKPFPISSIVDNYSTSNQVNVGTDVTVAPIKQGTVPGYYPSVLSYAINDNGEISFSGTLANSLTPADKAGDILAILQNMPGAACTFVQFNEQTHKNDTYLVCTGSATSGPQLIDIVGVNLHGISNINIVEPNHWSQ